MTQANQETAVMRVPDFEPGWKRALANEFQQPYMAQLKSFLIDEMKTATVYPPSNLIFNAFQQTPFDKVKVVILGQDPYHGPGQAHGLCFSVPRGIDPPPSLVNVFKEIHSDLKLAIPTHGCLEYWAQQGVFLLNTCLTVRARQPQSHAGQGWEQFTDQVIKTISCELTGVVFLLWGRPARMKASLIDQSKHFILEAVHPSPLSAHRGFLGCRHFSKTNKILDDQWLKPIDWSLPN